MTRVGILDGLREGIMFKRVILTACALLCGLLCAPVAGAAGELDLSEAVVLVRPGESPNAEQAAATVLVEEIEKRTGVRLDVSASWPAGKTVVAITSQRAVPEWGRAIPVRQGTDLAEARPEGYRLFVDADAATVWIMGTDARGALYGVGALLRNLDWARGKATVSASLDIATAPAYPIRGHQLGFRPQANSWDAWTPQQFDQYIRELTFFGVNSTELKTGQIVIALGNQVSAIDDALGHVREQLQQRYARIAVVIVSPLGIVCRDTRQRLVEDLPIGSAVKCRFL